MVQTPDASFILSVERGKLEAQAILLVESLRTFGGRYANCPIYAVSPRSDRRMSEECIQTLKSLEVNIVLEDLFSVEEGYGTIARLVACVWAEKNLACEILISLDDDLFFMNEPDFDLEQADFLARPVDVKGICTTGPGDLLDPYWQSIARCCGIDYEKIPWLETTIDRIRVKASYNGGMIAVRRSLGLFQRATEMFSILRRNDLSPRQAGAINVFASTGFVGAEASRWWGSSQAVLSLAATQLQAGIAIAPPTYNIPAHLIEQAEKGGHWISLQHAVLVHYHWLLDREHAVNGELFYGGHTLPGYVRDWLKPRIPLGGNYS